MLSFQAAMQMCLTPMDAPTLVTAQLPWQSICAHLECCVQAACEQEVAAGVPGSAGDAGRAAAIVLQQRVGAQVPQLHRQAVRQQQYKTSTGTHALV